MYLKEGRDRQFRVSRYKDLCCVSEENKTAILDFLRATNSRVHFYRTLERGRSVTPLAEASFSFNLNRVMIKFNFDELESEAYAEEEEAEDENEGWEDRYWSDTDEPSSATPRPSKKVKRFWQVEYKPSKEVHGSRVFRVTAPRSSAGDTRELMERCFWVRMHYASKGHKFFTLN